MRGRRAPTSIRFYLAALALVPALPLAILHVAGGWSQYKASSTEAELAARGLAEAAAAGTQQLLSDAENVLTQVSESMASVLRPGAQCGGVVRSVSAVTPFLVNVLVVEADGRVACSAIQPHGEATPKLGDSEWFTRAARSVAFTVGSPFLDPISTKWITALAVPILDADSSFRGALVGTIELPRFQELLAGVPLEENDVLTISDANRVVVARSAEADRWVGTTLPDPVQEERTVAPHRSVASGPDLAGVERTWSQIHLPATGWTVYAGVSTEEFRAPALALARRRAALTLLILTLSAVGGWWLGRIVTASMASLVSGARAAAEGHPVPVPRRAPAEVLSLVADFNESLEARNRAERAERNAKERYRSILDDAVFGIFLSTEDGRFLEVNPALASMLGYDSPDELVALGPVALYPDPSIRTSLLESYDETGAINGLEVEWRKKSGELITVRLNGKLVSVPDADRAYEMMAEDITREKALHEELRHTQKMEAIGRLAGGVAHDFNNLLTVIGGNTQILLDGMAAGDPRRLEMGEIEDAVRRAEGLTRQLLSFSRKQKPRLRRIDVNQVVRGLQKMLRRLIGEDVLLRTRLAPTLPMILADVGQLEQVIMNLAVNARDAMPDGGSLTIQTLGAPQRIGPGTTPGQEGWVCISVTDTGIGMDAATKERIFEPFFTTKGDGEGTGLGLATAYGIVSLAGGSISVESDPGFGTSFEVWFPAHDGEDAGDVRPENERPTPRGNGTILVAEDEEPVRRIVKKVLEGAGYDVLVAADGWEAIQISDRHPGRIDLVVTDVVMPNVKGTELAEHIARTRPDSLILFISGYTDNLPVQAHLEGGGAEFLAKPFTPQHLRVRVRSLLDTAVPQPKGQARRA